MEIRFYNGKNLQIEKTISNSEIINANFTVGLHGSLNGEVIINETDNNKNFLKSVSKLSHFIKLEKNSKIYGAIISSVFINNNTYTINIIGFFEYLEEIIAVSTRKSTVLGTSSIYNSDNSWIENYYADSPIGLFYGILKSTIEVMNDRGYSPNFDISELISHISMNTDKEWSRSYRINSLEAKTINSIIKDILNDIEMDGLKVSVDDSNTFKWKISIVKSFTEIYINETTDNVFNIEFGEDDSKTAAYSTLTGTALNGNDLISTLKFNNSKAYSTFVVENPVEKTSDINRLNKQGQEIEKNKNGQLSFSRYSDNIDLLNIVTINSSKMGTHTGYVTEYTIDGKKVDYKIQLFNGTLKTAGLRKPINTSRKILFNPLNYSLNTSRGQVFKKNNAPTGWR